MKIPPKYQICLILHDFQISKNTITRKRGYTAIRIPRFLLATWHASLPSHLRRQIDITRLPCSLLIPAPERVALPTRKKRKRKSYCFKITDITYSPSPFPRARLNTALCRILHRKR